MKASIKAGQTESIGGERPARLRVDHHRASVLTGAGFGAAELLAVGNQQLLGWLRAGGIQAKVEVSRRGDSLEQEADRVAEQVTSSVPSGVGRESLSSVAAGSFRSSAETPVRSEAAAAFVAPSEAAALPAWCSSGQPLPPDVSARFEPRFGRDLSQVRVHTDVEGAELASDLSAHAFTLGSHIIFGKDRYQPSTPEGLRLIAHELTHVAQQGAAPPSGATDGRTAPRAITRGASPVIQRDDDEQAVPDPNKTPRPMVVPTGFTGVMPNLDTPGFDPNWEQLHIWLAVKYAQAKYGNPVHKMLVAHYAYANGATFLLTKDLMPQVIGRGSSRLNIFKHFPGVTAAKTALKAELAAQGGGVSSRVQDISASAPVSTGGSVSCDKDKPSLGGFTCYLDGTLVARLATSSEVAEFEFGGTMRWYDYWDFDPMRLAKPDEMDKVKPAWRTPQGEEATRKGAAWLPGIPFVVESEDVEVHQKDSDPAPQW
jgi:hypothetical protein